MPLDGLRNSALLCTLADVLDDLPDLFQKEIRLAQAEFTGKIKDGVQASAWMMVAGLLGVVTFLSLASGRHFRNREPWSRASLGLLDRRCRGWWMRRGGFPLRAFHHAEYARTDQKRQPSQ